MVYQIMGRDPVWGFTKLVQIWDTQPKNPDEWVETVGLEGERGWLKLSSPVESDTEKFLNTVAGPLAGLFSAALGLLIERRSENTIWKQVALAYTLSASLAAILYYLRSPMRSGGDEYVIAMFLGVPKLVIEIILALGFVACLSFALRELLSWRIQLYWLGVIFLGAVATGLLMALSDPLISAQVDAANPWFQPIIGYSLPVFLVIGLAFFGIWLWTRWRDFG
jgi:hypothetical protein